jgi:hypothetical protein
LAEACGDARFSLAGIAEKGDYFAGDHNCAGMQHQSSLLA